MIRLDTTTRKLQVKLGTAATTNQLPVVVSFSDKTATAYNGGTQCSNTNNTTAVDICAAPAASTVRDVDYISIINRDTTPTPVIVQLYDNGTTYSLIEKTLAVGEQLCYTHASGWAEDQAVEPQGASGSVQFNNNGMFSGATNVDIDNGDLTISFQASPVTPATDQVKIYGKKIGGRIFPAAVGPSAMDYALQPAAWRQKFGLWTPPGNATTVPGVTGITAPTALGTATSRTVAATNLFTRTRRLGYVSSTTAGNFAGGYINAAQYTLGTGSPVFLGGFFFSIRFAFSDAASVAGARSFIGLSSSVAAPTNVEASTLTNSIGVAQLSTDTSQLYIVYGGSAAQTAIPLGGNFPPMNGTGATNGVLYDFTLFSPPNENSVVYYSLERVGTSFSATGTLGPGTSVTLPTSTTLLAPRFWRCNNATALAVGIDVVSIYVETDY